MARGSDLVHVRVSKTRKKALETLVERGHFRSMAEAVNTGLTILLERYGLIGAVTLPSEEKERGQ
jgi:Arc/MetJ-type ribon-helix-helix transcriptional regulator